MKIIPG